MTMFVPDEYSKKIIEYLKVNNGCFLSYSSLGREVGLLHPEKVKHRLRQLEQYNILRKMGNKVYEVIEELESLPSKEYVKVPRAIYNNQLEQIRVMEEKYNKLILRLAEIQKLTYLE